MPMNARPTRAYWVVSVLVVVVVLGLFVWQPWNSNGVLWGK